MEYKVGQELLEVITLNVRGDPKMRKVVVTKVGRKWVSYESKESNYKMEDRFDAETGRIDSKNFSSPGRVFLSLQNYHDTEGLFKEWTNLRCEISGKYSIPEGLSHEDIAAIRKILKLERKS